MTGLPEVAPPNSIAPAEIDGRSGKPKQVSLKVRKAIKLLVTGDCRTMSAAADRAGLSAEHLSRVLRQPHVARYVDGVTRSVLAAGALPAATRVLELMNAESEHVSLDAARHVLAIQNVRPPDQRPGVSVNINNNIAPGYCIDLTPWATFDQSPTAQTPTADER